MSFKKIFLSLSALFLTVLLIVFLVIDSGQESGGDLTRTRSESKDSFITLPDGVTHYSLTGTDRAGTIVMVTGGGITGMEVWQENIPFLVSKGYRVLAYDLYGRGLSDRPDAAVNPAMLTKQLKSLVDTLGIKKPFNMVAMSFGAIIALDYNKLYPGTISLLALLDPTATGEYRISKTLKFPVVRPLVMTMYWYPRAIENQRKEFVNQELFATYSKRLEYYMQFKGFKKMTLDTWNYVLNQDRLSLLANFPPGKVLVVYGDRDPYFPEGNIPLFKKVYPTLTSTVIEGTGHMPQLEKPERVNVILENFFAENNN